ncbi:hypothetical protein ACQJBY_043396 [Aegilops geniculata]
MANDARQGGVLLLARPMRARKERNRERCSPAAQLVSSVTKGPAGHGLQSIQIRHCIAREHSATHVHRRRNGLTGNEAYLVAAHTGQVAMAGSHAPHRDSRRQRSSRTAEHRRPKATSQVGCSWSSLAWRPQRRPRGSWRRLTMPGLLPEPLLQFTVAVAPALQFST